jgi:hypothetical protein
MINRFVSVIFILCTGISFSQTLSADLEMPKGVELGSDFIVKVTITKNNLKGLIKFYQTLPENYTASEADLKGGAFTVKDNLLEITWLSPPRENVYSFVYKLKVPENAKDEEEFKARVDYYAGLTTQSFTFVNKTIKLNQLVVNNNFVFEGVDESTAGAKVIYSVQFGVFVTTPTFKGIKDVTTLPLNKRMTRYLSGEFNTRKKAELRREELRAKGFKDAFIVKLKDGQIIK